MFLSQSFSVPKPSSLSEEVSIGRCNTDGNRNSNSKDQYVVKLPPIEKSKNIYKDDVNKSLKLHIAYQALDQCEMSIKCLGIARITSTDNTAGAAKMVALDKVIENGAIASARAAEIYGLDILAHKFQDAYENVTRFLILAREPITFTNNARKYKTSVVFTLKEGHGAVVEALAVFALRSINLCKIESRPLEKHSLSKLVNGGKYKSNMYFDYCFFIDFEASVVEPRTQYALEHLKEFTNFLRILGCYPLDNNKAVPIYEEEEGLVMNLSACSKYHLTCHNKNSIRDI